MYYFCTRKQANGVVVQLVRMPACHAGGREFESRPYRKIPEILLDFGDFDFMCVGIGTRDRNRATKFVQHNKRRYPLKGISYVLLYRAFRLAIALQDFMRQL